MQIGRTRCLLGFLLALLWSVAPLTLPGLNAQAQKIRISLSSRSNTNATYYVAQGKGFFKDEGLEVEFIQVNPRLGAMAVLNGDVTFTTSFVSTFRGIVQGLPMKTVFILLKKGTYYLMVRPDLIKDIQDLKGKKLGVTAVNGGDHIIGRELLRTKGLDPNLVQAIAKDGQMTDAEIEFQMDRLAEKKRPLDEVRDFSFARQAVKELEAGR